MLEVDKAGTFKDWGARVEPWLPVPSTTAFVPSAVRKNFMNAEYLAWNGNAPIAGIP